MKIDVIIPTYKPGPELEVLLRCLNQQSLPVQKIFLMNTEEEFFVDIDISAFSNVEVKHLKKVEFDHGGTRHLGAELSDADYLLYMTQDALPVDKELVENLAKAFEKPEVKAAYGRQLPNASCKFLEKYTRSFNYPDISRVKTKKDINELGIKTFFCSNVCAMYERDTYFKQGGFERKTIFNEDMIFAGGLIKAGYGIAYVADARVCHSHNYNGMEQLKRNFDLAVSQADHPEVFEGVPSEKEGIKLVKSTAVYCIQEKRPWLIFSLVFLSGCKYIGYKLGRNYKKLPKWLIEMSTMNKAYWKTYWKA